MKNKVIAITGGIGSGKSEVIKYLRSLGYATIDCDALAKEISTRPAIVENVRQLLGDEFIVNAQLNRKAIRDTVFADKRLLQQYNAIYFAEVKKLLDERVAQLSNSKCVFVEISVFEAFDYLWDGVWLVDADEVTRVERAIARDGSSHETLLNIVSSQRICSDYTLSLNNNGTLDDLKRQVDRAISELVI